MVKTHNCLVRIRNNTTYEMTYLLDWYDSGRLADGFSWPTTIAGYGDHDKILNYESDNSSAGCSGYVTYTIDGVNVTIAFSNPANGVNKLGVGTGGKGVWDDMSNHDYKSFNVSIPIEGRDLTCVCQCSGGTTNSCSVVIEMAYAKSTSTNASVCNLY